MSVYTTLPTTPNGQLAFAPDGTLYAVTGYNGVQQVVQIGGTNTPSPPSMTTLVGHIRSFFCLTMGEAQSNGAAKSLIVCDTNGIELIDITTTPFTATVLVASGVDRIRGHRSRRLPLQPAVSDTIYKLAPSDGGCGFVPTNPGTGSGADAGDGDAESYAREHADVHGDIQERERACRNAGALHDHRREHADQARNDRCERCRDDHLYRVALAGTDTVTAPGDAALATLDSNPATRHVGSRAST